MATGKRYYWIKLKVNFMTSETVDFLMSQENGAEYVVLYQMLCLKTINTGGRLERHIGEVIIPYDETKIQRDCKWFSIDTIRVALNLYKQLGLIYMDQDGVLCLAGHQEMIGSETDYSEQKRRQRAIQGPGTDVDNVHTDVHDEGVDIVHTENRYIENRYIEIDNRDRDKEIDTERNVGCRKKKGTTFESNSKPYLLATFLGKRIKTRLPSTENPSESTLQAWADAFDKCNRLDGHSWDEIKLVLKFSQEDAFWQQNILSGKKFREKYVELLAKMSAPAAAASRQTTQGTSTVDRLLELAQKGAFDDE